MVEVDPVVLVAAGTLIVGLATVAACMRPSVPATKPKEKVAPAQKQKKKSKSAKTKSAAGKLSGSGVEQSSGDESARAKSKVSEIKSKQTKPSKAAIVANRPSDAKQTDPKSVSYHEEHDDDEHGDDEDMAMLAQNVASEPTGKKSKKSKETAEKKAARIEKQKQAQSAPKAETEHSGAGSAPKVASQPPTASPASLAAPAVSSSSVAAPPASAPAVASVVRAASSSPPATFDGWAVVEDKRKQKGKKDTTEGDELGDGNGATTTAPTAPIVPAAAAAAAAVEDSGASSPAPPAPVVDSVTTQVTVDARRLGLLIGPKGVTKIGMQTATGTEISMPKVERDFSGPVELSVTGPAEGVQSAVRAINELCAKGYCNLLAAEDFHEGYVAVHPKHLPDIIGKGGSCIKAIQTHTGVKINTPSGFSKTTPSGETVVPSKVKISLAGPREKVTEARQLILDLTKYFHTPVTHPGVSHIEMDIPNSYFNFIIGPKGSEIKHIQSNYKVSVHIPNADSSNQSVLVVGDESNVAQAEKHIRKIVEKTETMLAERAAAQAAGIALGESAKAKLAAQQAQQGQGAASSSGQRASSAATAGGRGTISLGGGGGNPNARPPRADKEEPEEEWVSDFAPRSNTIQMDFGSVLPASAKFAPAPAASAPVPTPPAPGLEPPKVADDSAPTGGDVAADSSAPSGEAQAAPAGSAAAPSAWGGMGALQTDRWG